jgi:hypothetical protein
MKLRHLIVNHPFKNSMTIMTIAIQRNQKFSRREKKFSPTRPKTLRVKMIVMVGEDLHLLSLQLHLIKMERIQVQIAKMKSID